MKDWLKFFGLSFFSDNIAKGAATRGVMNCVLGFVLTLIFTFCGVLAANTVPFYTHYNNASQFRAAIYDTVDALSMTVSGGIVDADRQINTTLDGASGANGYTVIVDTREATALDDFEAYCLFKDGKTEIPYENYLELSDEQKSDYAFKIRYTPNELVLTDELVEGYESFLSASEDSNIATQYAALAAKKGEPNADEYRLSMYKLYVSAYYPAITSFERVGEVPLLRSYYYRNYLNSNDITKSLFVFSDVMFAFFDTDGGLSITFYGSYERVNNGALTTDNVDEFMKAVFGASVSTSANIYLMNTCKYIPLIALIPLVLALVVKLFFMLSKIDKSRKFSVCFKTECAYLFLASLLSALAVFICGFFVSSNIVNVLPLIIFAGVMTVRTIIFIVGEIVADKKRKAVESRE